MERNSPKMKKMYICSSEKNGYFGIQKQKKW